MDGLSGQESVRLYEQQMRSRVMMKKKMMKGLSTIPSRRPRMWMEEMMEEVMEEVMEEMMEVIMEEMMEVLVTRVRSSRPLSRTPNHVA